jgi:ornithine carbamoyltransferase
VFWGVDIIRGKVLCMLFYEPSMERSSVQKGETLQDTIRTLASPSRTTETRLLCAILTLAVHSSLRSTPVPILSAGSGTSKHPTPALLNVYTIRSELGYGERAHDRMCAGSACRQVVARPRQPHLHFLRHPSRIRHLQLFRLRNHSRPRGVVASAPAT